MITICKIDSQWESPVCCRELKSAALRPPRDVGWDGWWAGDSRGREHLYTYGRFMLIYGRNQYSIVKQLSFN